MFRCLGVQGLGVQVFRVSGFQCFRVSVFFQGFSRFFLVFRVFRVLRFFRVLGLSVFRALGF